MFPASKVMAAIGAFALIMILAVTVVVAQSIVDLDRPAYPAPIENR
jgi:hypothetical protein